MSTLSTASYQCHVSYRNLVFLSSHITHTPLNNIEMGPRPQDFDEEIVRKAPTFVKWMKLLPGEKIKYAGREFTKGFGEDEERLMRRIMIARRNNLKDHAVLKKARAMEAERVRAEAMAAKTPGMRGRKRIKSEDESEGFEDSLDLEGLLNMPSKIPTNPSGTKRRQIAGKLRTPEEEVMTEMDISAVKATRSYQKWLALPDGETFTYNQTYTKGEGDHDWLLKKNIWRRMRYRRENRKMVAELQGESVDQWNDWKAPVAERKAPPEPGFAGGDVNAAVAAAAAAAVVSYASEPGIDADEIAALDAESAVHDPLVTTSALDAAAKLAASVAGLGEDDAVQQV